MSRMNFRRFMAGLTIAVMISGAGFPVVEAARGGGGGNRVQSRPADRPAQKPADRQNINTGNRNTNVNNSGNRNTNVNTGNINTGNINVDRNTNVHVDAGYGVPVGGPYHGGAYYGGAPYYGAPVAGAFIAGLVVGAVVNSYPPSSQTVVVQEVTYIYDGTNYYKEVYNGTEVVYKVVPAPK